MTFPPTKGRGATGNVSLSVEQRNVSRKRRSDSSSSSEDERTPLQPQVRGARTKPVRSLRGELTLHQAGFQPFVLFKILINTFKLLTALLSANSSSHD